MKLHELTVGQRYLHSHFGRQTLCEIVRTGIEDDGRGETEMMRIWDKDGDQPTKYYQPMQSLFVVELAWFARGNHKVERVLI